MASNYESAVSGGSDSDLDFSSAPEDMPSSVTRPEHDGLPQVCSLGISLLAAVTPNLGTRQAH